LYLSVFERPASMVFFNNLLVQASVFSQIRIPKSAIPWTP
jgi:hypothetical protein